MIAGLLLVLSGGLVALGVSNDWLIASLPGGSDATLHLVGTRFGSALFAFAGALAILGLWRLGRGYSSDDTVHRLATTVALAGLAVGVIRVFLFLGDHSLAITASSTYLHDLSLQPGLYFVAGGLVLALLTRFG